MLSLIISNSSKGIPESDRERIFDRFHRGDAARTRQRTRAWTESMQEIARAYGGKLTLDQAAGEQTTFILTLPLIHGKD